MPTPPVSDKDLRATVAAYEAAGRNQTATAQAMGLARETVQNRLKRAAERGLMGPVEALPGYTLKSVATKSADGSWVKQAKEPGPAFEMPPGHMVKGVSALVDAEGRVLNQWIKTRDDAEAQLAAMQAAVQGFKDEIPRVAPVAVPKWTVDDLLCFYCITDVHLGALAWHEETGNADYDTAIAEKLLEDWFAAAIDMAPAAGTAILANLGDLAHYDSFESVTPAHRNVLDSDSRYPKIVRSIIRVLRKIIARLLEKHERVHILMCDANHDPAGETWLREMFAAFYDNEPRVTVDNSAGTYYCYRHGDVSLFAHHGHRRGVKDVDSVFAGRFREVYGNTKFSFAHLGHKHADEVRRTNLMKVEQHETLAAPDAYAANGGWLSGRSAKVIFYHKRHGEVGRFILTPEMVVGATDQPIAANDNEKKEMAA